MTATRFFPVAIGLLLRAAAGQAQAPSCEQVRTGTYTLVAPLHDGTRIVRTKNKQVETNDSLGVETHSRVRWLNSCTYQLYDKKLIRGPERFAGRKGHTLTVRITKVLPLGYQALVSSNFNTTVLPVTLAVLP